MIISAKVIEWSVYVQEIPKQALYRLLTVPEQGMEGGVDEELDFDEAEEFQDDDDNNTFYRDVREEDEARELEERLKKEFRVANANVGDRPQIDAEDDEDDLFGDKSLDDEGKKLRKIMRRRMKENGEDYDIDDESVSRAV